MKDEALDNWIDALIDFSRNAIEHALHSHIQTASHKPTISEIRTRAKDFQFQGKTDFGDRSSLSMDEQFALNEKVLPTARRWIKENAPGHPMYRHAQSTLEFWGETI